MEHGEELALFFGGLDPRLETAQTRERELDVKLARRFNAFDYLDKRELSLSRIIANLLNPSGSHGQGTLFLNILLRGCGLTWACDLQRAEIGVEAPTAEGRRLDISVRIDNEHCLVIENKPYARDQPSQIEDYLDEIKKYRNFLLIYLSPNGEAPEAESVTLNNLGELRDGQLFRIMPYREASDLDWNDEFGTYRMCYSLIDWLAECRKNCDVDRLRWFLREAETFCERQFGGNTMTDIETSAIKEFVLAEKRNWEIALALTKSLPEIGRCVCKSALDLIWKACNWPDDYCCIGGLKWANPKKRQHCLAVWKDSWQPYGTDRDHTSVVITSDDRRWNKWFVGVRSPMAASNMTAEERERREKLAEELKELELPYKGDGMYLCAEYLDQYKDWDPLIPDLRKEIEAGGGCITDYFVARFTTIVKMAFPIIDRVEGGGERTSS